MSGRETKPRLPRMPGQTPRKKPSLVAAAHAQASSGSGSSSSTPVIPAVEQAEPQEAVEAMDVDEAGGDVGEAEVVAQLDPPEASAPASAAAPVPPAPAPPAPAPPTAPALSRTTSGSTLASDAPSVVPKMKFKPKMPIRRSTQAPPAEPVSKPDPEPAPSTRGSARGRGRGGARGGRPLVSTNTIAAGPFGGARAGSSRRVIPAAPSRSFMSEMQTVEVYSDNEDGTRTGVIDIEAVSALGESAPTSLWRDRDLGGGKAKAKAAKQAQLKDMKRRRKAESAATADTGVSVKAEPLSPVNGVVPLPNLPSTRQGDTMIAADAVQDRDEAGRRIRATTSGAYTTESEDINAAQAVDLSESESEEEEGDMEGDFVYVPGLDNPEDKLFTFQFPPGFPKLVSKTPAVIDATDLAEESKPTATTMKKRKPSHLPPPEGRIGTLCMMKSGKVKLVLGEGDDAIVMNVTPGVNASFVQQLVHLDPKTKTNTVLGEVHKGYVVTPDLDRLLEELFINGGETPGDRERAQAMHERRVKTERGLVKMEPGSP